MAYSVELKARQAAENSAAFIEKCSAFNTQTLFRSIAVRPKQIDEQGCVALINLSWTSCAQNILGVP